MMCRETGVMGERRGTGERATPASRAPLAFPICHQVFASFSCSFGLSGLSGFSGSMNEISQIDQKDPLSPRYSVLPIAIRHMLPPPQHSPRFTFHASHSLAFPRQTAYHSASPQG